MQGQDQASFAPSTNSEEVRELPLLIASLSRTTDKLKIFSPLPELLLIFSAERSKPVFYKHCQKLRQPF
jgi:hypothetical protein